jgi:hypothetical protein
MIENVIERWHRYLRGELPGGLDELLADDVVFYSPIVHTPQRGKDARCKPLTPSTNRCAALSRRCTSPSLAQSPRVSRRMGGAQNAPSRFNKEKKAKHHEHTR